MKTNTIYRHFKGGLYKVIAIAKNADTGEKYVIYQSLSSYDTYARPIKNFVSKVDKKKYPTAKQKYRFERVERREKC